MRRTVAEHVIEQLAAWEVPYVFGLAGDTVIPLLEALRREARVRYVGVRHEESAGFMASAYAKLTGRLGVCLAEAGPASVHLLNGVYDAHMDRVPLFALTGQSETKRLGTHWPQTVNQDLLYEDATCFNHTLASEEQLADVLYDAMRKAILEADAARLGLPVDLQLRPARGPIRPRPAHLGGSPAPDPEAVREAARLLQGAKRPVLFVGQGARGAETPLLELAERLSAAIVHTLPAMGIVPAEHPRNLGVIGEFGTEVAALAFAQADVVLVVGSTWWQPQYVPGARFIQIDRSPGNVGALFPAAIGLAGDAREVLPALLEAIRPAANPAWDTLLARLRAEWEQRIESGSAAHAPEDPLADGARGLWPHDIVRLLQEQVSGDAILCLDVGDNTFWMSSLFKASGQRVLVSGHWRSMGFGLPAAIAAKLCHPDRQVVAVVGDGGFAMTMAEFATAVALELPITVVILNNRALAEEGHEQVRMKLEPFGIGLHNPDFAQYARACGGEGHRVEANAELATALAGALKAGRPCILDVATARLMPAFPRGRGTLQPSPPTKPEKAELLRV